MLHYIADSPLLGESIPICSGCGAFGESVELAFFAWLTGRGEKYYCLECEGGGDYVPEMLVPGNGGPVVLKSVDGKVDLWLIEPQSGTCELYVYLLRNNDVGVSYINVIPMDLNGHCLCGDPACLVVHISKNGHKLNGQLFVEVAWELVERLGLMTSAIARV